MEYRKSIIIPDTPTSTEMMHDSIYPAKPICMSIFTRQAADHEKQKTAKIQDELRRYNFLRDIRATRLLRVNSPC